MFTFCSRLRRRPVLGLLLKALAARQTRYVNRVEGRSGTLWERRYNSSPVDTERYLLECSRYIELNPLRAGIVGCPEHYRWSSFGGKAGLWEDRLLDLDPCYLAMGKTEQQRRSRYAAFVSQGVRPSELILIREALQRGQLTGTQRFVDEIDRKLGVRVERRGEDVPQRVRNKSVTFSPFLSAPARLRYVRAKSLSQVSALTTPFCGSCSRTWKAATASLVIGPNSPSPLRSVPKTMLSRIWMRLTSIPVAFSDTGTPGNGRLPATSSHAAEGASPARVQNQSLKTG